MCVCVDAYVSRLRSRCVRSARSTSSSWTSFRSIGRRSSAGRTPSVTVCPSTTASSRSYTNYKPISSHIDLQTHAGIAYGNRVTLTCDLLNAGSMHAEALPWTICVPNLVLIAQVGFFFQSADRQTDRHTHTHTRTHSHRPRIRKRSPPAWVMLLLWRVTFLNTC